MKHSRLALFGFAVSSALIATPALAEEASSGTGVQIGLRAGYSLPMGEITKDDKFSDTVARAIPIQLDVGYRVMPALVVGAFFSYAPLKIKDESDGCPSGADCSYSQMRFGVQGQYHLMPAATFDPWVGLGVGYEILNFSAKKDPLEVSSSIKGLEFASLQVGGDYKVMPKLAVGPFLSFAVGRYSSQSMKVSGTGANDTDKTEDVPSDERALHQWLTFGVRGAFDL
jgi:outer membrane protein W